MSGVDEMKVATCSRCGETGNWFMAQTNKGEVPFYFKGESKEFYGSDYVSPPEIDVEEPDWIRGERKFPLETIRTLRTVVCQECEGIFTGVDIEYNKFLALIEFLIKNWDDDE